MAQKTVQLEDPPLAKFLFSNTKLSILWLPLRLYVGWEWLHAGWTKMFNPAWTGEASGKAITGFVMGALEKTNGAHPDVSMWYAEFLKSTVLPNASLFSHIVAYGEFLVGIGLILGAFTGIAAFFGAFMNMNYLFAGTVSSNPLLFIIELFLILAWKTAGWIGLDRILLPMLGTPWNKGHIFKKKS